MSQESPPPEQPEQPQGGFIVIWREIRDSWVWGLPAIQRLIAIELLIEANWRPRRVVTRKGSVMIPRGSCIIGTSEFADRIGVSRQQLRTALINLRNGGFLTSKSTNRGTLVSIVNYDRYQNRNWKGNQQINQENEVQPTSSQPTPNQRLTTPEPSNQVTSEPEDGAQKAPSRPPPEQKSRVKTHSNRKAVIEAYHEAHKAAMGDKPSWGPKQRTLANELAGRGVSAADVTTRAGVMFEMRGRFPAEFPDLATLSSHWDKFVPGAAYRPRHRDRPFEDYPPPGEVKLKP